ncbi:MAG: ABC transporter substrate-binding protein [Betaproteobacteria bacterium]
MSRVRLTVLFVFALLSLTCLTAGAEVSEVRLAQQFSMGYMQFAIMEHNQLIEKHARAAGLGEIKVFWDRFNGPNFMNDALLAGKVDYVSGGVPGLITLWEKTLGTPQEVRGVSALSSQPFLLNSRSPNIKSIRDFTEKDRIAVPSIKSSVQAVTLQMAAAQLLGDANFGKYDNLTVSMSPPDSTVALLSGASEINNVFSVPPFQFQQLEKPGIHTILNSFDVMGGAHTFTVIWTTSKFREANPKTYKAVLAALQEATEILNKDKRAASQMWIEQTKSNLTVDWLSKIVSNPQVQYTLVPNNTTKYSDFMHKVGSIKKKPASWKDLFFPEIHNLPGS